MGTHLDQVKDQHKILSRACTNGQCSAWLHNTIHNTIHFRHKVSFRHSILIQSHSCHDIGFVIFYCSQKINVQHGCSKLSTLGTPI